jgi:hypothetical protein
MVRGEDNEEENEGEDDEDGDERRKTRKNTRQQSQANPISTKQEVGKGQWKPKG